MFRAMRTDDVTSLTGTSQQLDWDTFQNGDATVFQPRNAADSADAVSGVSDTRNIRLKKAGLYTFTVGIKENTADGGYKIAFNDNDPVWGYSEDHLSGPTTTYNIVGFVTWTFSRAYPIWDPFSTPPSWPNFGLSAFVPANFTVAANHSGTARTITNAFLDVYYDPNVTFP